MLRRWATHNRLFDTMAALRRALRANLCCYKTLRHKVLSLIEGPRSPKDRRGVNKARAVLIQWGSGGFSPDGVRRAVGQQGNAIWDYFLRIYRRGGLGGILGEAKPNGDNWNLFGTSKSANENGHCAKCAKWPFLLVFMARPKGFEPLTFASGGRRSIQLS